MTIGDRSACCAVAVNDIAARVTKEERKKIRASGEKKVKSRWKLVGKGKEKEPISISGKVEKVRHANL